MQHPSVSWHIIPLTISNGNITCFGQKEPINVQFFRLLDALMKVHSILHGMFETTRSGFIQIVHHCSVSWKKTPLLFCIFLAQTSYTLDKNSPSQWNFCIFKCLGENLPNFSCHIWNHKFFFKLGITLQCLER